MYFLRQKYEGKQASKRTTEEGNRKSSRGWTNNPKNAFSRSVGNGATGQKHLLENEQNQNLVNGLHLVSGSLSQEIFYIQEVD